MQVCSQIQEYESLKQVKALNRTKTFVTNAETQIPQTDQEKEEKRKLNNHSP